VLRSFARGVPVHRDDLSESELKEIMAFRSHGESQMVAIVGDPLAATDMVQRFVDVGVDELILVMQLGTVPHEVVMRSIRTFGEKVMPHFA